MLETHELMTVIRAYQYIGGFPVNLAHGHVTVTKEPNLKSQAMSTFEDKLQCNTCAFAKDFSTSRAS